MIAVVVVVMYLYMFSNYRGIVFSLFLFTGRNNPFRPFFKMPNVDHLGT